LALALVPPASAQWLESDCVSPLEIEGVDLQDTFGFVADSVGDVTGDGIGDIVSAAPLSSLGFGSSGFVRVYDGVTGSVLWTRTGRHTSAILGFAIRVADWNGDGVLDVFTSEPFGAGLGGHVWVLSGDDGRVLHEFNPSDVSGDSFGYGIAVGGDFDGDGVDDVAIGSAGYDPPGLVNAGRVYVYSGATGAQITAIDGPGIAGGDASFGTGLTFLNDVDGDGRDDLVAGYRDPSFVRGSVRAYGWNGAQAVELYSVADVGMPSQLFGTYVEGGADVSGDGVGDFVVGDLREDVADVFSGADGALLYTLDGEGQLGGFGSGEIVPDLDGDGLADLILGARSNDAGAQDAGRIFFYSGRTGTLLRTATHTVAGQRIGLACRWIGDHDGDGADDYVVAGTGGGTGGPPLGRLFVLKGAAPFDRFCSATPSSTGQPAYLGAVGRPSVAANELVFTASPVPTATFGILFYGSGQTQVPLGNGTRCVGGATVRRLPVEQAVGAVWRHGLDLSRPPASSLLQPGTHWHFQVWYRDSVAGGAGVDLSDGLSVTFLP
ncbi:MAG: VCBS repeat-containing protein, partial [Planctomycetota bacterium]